jgi:hypothetical protein
VREKGAPVRWQTSEPELFVFPMWLKSKYLHEFLIQHAKLVKDFECRFSVIVGR